jgi:hypothetical protein
MEYNWLIIGTSGGVTEYANEFSHPKTRHILVRSLEKISNGLQDTVHL